MLSKIKLFLFRKKFRMKNRHNYAFAVNMFNTKKIEIGKKTYAAINVVDFSPSNNKLKIGNYCSIASGVQFLLGGEHNINTITTYPFKVKKFGYLEEAGSKGNIIVEDDVWIGQNSLICSGVHIGQGAVIAAGAVVTKDVEPYAVVGGVPAKLLKYRFSQTLRERLLKLDITYIFDNLKKEDIELIYTPLTENVLDKLLKKGEK